MASSNNTLQHIVHGVMTLDVGGMERIVVDLTRESRGFGRKVSVICIERPGPLAEEIKQLGGQVISLDKPMGLHKTTFVKAGQVLADLMPCTLHTHQIGALWYLGNAAKSLGLTSVVHTEHIDNVEKSIGLYRKLRTRLLWSRAATYCRKFCCVSEDIARSAERWNTVPSKKVEVVLNGIDIARYSGRDEREVVRRKLDIDSDTLVVGTVGRLSEVKRQDLLIRAFADLSSSFSKLHLLIVGDGSERKALETLGNDLGIANRVTFAGYQAFPQNYLAAMDVFALSSRLEGLPLAMLEAWATRLPVISSAVGGIPKVVQHGRSGLLFANGDLTALTRLLGRLLQSGEERLTLAEEGFKMAEKYYSLTRMVDDYDAIYNELSSI